MYQEKFMDMNIYHETYEYFCHALPPQPLILEIGCGPGNITQQIFRLIPDARIVATDIAPNMVQLAQENNPNADCKILDARYIEQLDQHFHAIICGFCIPYLHPNDTKDFFQKMNIQLYQNGWVYLSFIQGEQGHSIFQKGSTGDGMTVFHYSTEWITSEMEKQGFERVRHFSIPYPIGEDETQYHIILIFRKNG